MEDEIFKIEKDMQDSQNKVHLRIKGVKKSVKQEGPMSRQKDETLQVTPLTSNNQSISAQNQREQHSELAYEELQP